MFLKKWKINASLNIERIFPVIENEKLKWKNLKTKKLSEIMETLRDFEIALTGREFKWIQTNRPDRVKKNLGFP